MLMVFDYFFFWPEAAAGAVCYVWLRFRLPMNGSPYLEESMFSESSLPESRFGLVLNDF